MAELWIAWMCCGELEIEDTKENAMYAMWIREDIDDGHTVQLIEGPNGQTITSGDDEYLQYVKQQRRLLAERTTKEEQAAPQALGRVEIAFPNSARDRVGRYAPARDVQDWYEVGRPRSEREVADAVERFVPQLGAERVRFVPFPGAI